MQETLEIVKKNLGNFIRNNNPILNPYNCERKITYTLKIKQKGEGRIEM